MPRARRPAIAEALRHRVQHGLASGALRPGDRLPSTREMAIDLDADPRVVAEAYRLLAGDGLVELRPRAGVFITEMPGAASEAGAPSAAWLADVVAEAVRRGVPAPTLGRALDSATRARAVNAAVIAPTVDQAVGIARELRDDFGITAVAYLAEQIMPGEPLPRALSRAHLLVSTEFTAERVTRIGQRLGVPALVIDVRPDLMSPAWRLLLREARREMLYVVIADPRFGSLVHAFLHGEEGAENVRVLVAGQDDVRAIPATSAVYVTEAARERLGRARLPARLVAPARTLNDASLREVAEALVSHNLAAGTRRRRDASIPGPSAAGAEFGPERDADAGGDVGAPDDEPRVAPGEAA